MKILNVNAAIVLPSLIEMIQEKKVYLSEIDGKIGDGDHGINMSKGFTLCQERLSGKDYTFSEGLMTLSDTLMEDIGGSMGPLYGVLFSEMSLACEDEIDAVVFENMMKSGLAGIQDISTAVPGDKTLLDTLVPAVESYSAALAAGKNFITALEEMKAGAKAGWESTEDMVANLGRSSRLGERSRGILDPGATSCYLILSKMADELEAQLA